MSILQQRKKMLILREKDSNDFGENLGFLRKSGILVKISDFDENLGFRRKSRISAKILDFVIHLGVFFG